MKWDEYTETEKSYLRFFGYWGVVIVVVLAVIVFAAVRKA